MEDARKHVADVQPCLDSFRIMDRFLRFNICDLENSFKSNDDIPDLQTRIGEKIPCDLRRACLSWSGQLRSPSLIIICALSHFFHNHLLSWLEVLSLIKKVDSARPVIEKAIELITVSFSKNAVISELK